VRGTGRLLLVLAAAACGCDSQDADRLARVGRKVADRAEAVAADTDGRLGPSWHTLLAKGESSVEGRVGRRLHWDKSLAGCAIEVSAAGGVVELKGKVQDLAQRRRAVELAGSTDGVEQVKDSLEGPMTND
jgi:hypothetical protein